MSLRDASTLKALLWFHTHPIDRGKAGEPPSLSSKEILLQEGLLEQDTTFLTEKGKAHVKALCAVEFPVQVWVSPEVAKTLEK